MRTIAVIVFGFLSAVAAVLGRLGLGLLGIDVGLLDLFLLAWLILLTAWIAGGLAKVGEVLVYNGLSDPDEAGE